jgi:hypothetical protein
LLPDLKAQSADFVYPVYVTVLFLLCVCAAILFVLHLMAQKNPNWKYFPILTHLTGCSGLSVYQACFIETIEVPAEKVNIFVIFMLFLMLEAYFNGSLKQKTMIFFQRLKILEKMRFSTLI